MSLPEIINSAALIAAVGLCVRTEARLTRLETLITILKGTTP